MNKSRADIARFHQRLREWYQEHGRSHLPWRNTDDAYAIYISEIMLQQTQVTTVLERFYFPFLSRFPTLASLAEASETDVLSAWQGLGYYSRARNLHRAAQQAAPALPNTLEGLRALPGIGRNTAHAVAAFAFRQPVAVMEANLRRVLCRIFALSVADEKQLWQLAQSLVDRDDPFNYNQAMMDIGSMLCKPRAPDCEHCPAATICEGKENPLAYPLAKAKKAVPERKMDILLLVDAQNRVYARPRTTRFLGGLYHFWEQPQGLDDFALPFVTLRRSQSRMLGHIRQQYSHFTLEADIYLARYEGKEKLDFHDVHALLAFPFSGAERKILPLLQEALMEEMT